MKYIIFILTFLLPMKLFSQKNDKDTLREVIIKERKDQGEIKPLQIDSTTLNAYRHTSLQQVLQLHSNVFVKNYGIGSLSTISMRGSSAAQTSVIWQGMNINNAMTGIADFSILPVSFFEEVDISYSGMGGSPGGSILLNSSAMTFRKQSTFNAGAAYESLQNTAYYTSLLKSNHKFAFNVKGFYQRANNLFRYYHPEHEQFEMLTHAASNTAGLMTGIQYKPAENQVLQFHAWLQAAGRDIPPALFENKSTKSEKNQSLRAVLMHDARAGSWTIKSSLGLMQESMVYNDSMIRFTSDARALSIPLIETLAWFPSAGQKISVVATAVYAKLLSGHKEDIRRGAVAVHYEAEPFRKKLFFNTFIQKEYSNAFSLPLIAGLRLKQKIYREHFVFASLASAYRMPTLNELYFIPGGNKNLKPENSRNLEGGFESTILSRTHILRFDISFFSRNVKNWIVWYGGSILTPHNIQKVWSRGLETELKYTLRLKTTQQIGQDIMEVNVEHKPGTSVKQFPLRQTNVNVHLLYSYVLATTRESAVTNDYSIGKQIPYVPRYQLKLNTGFTKDHFDFSYVYAYTGYRFVTTDESEYLLPYDTHNIFASCRLYFKDRHQILTSVKINNLFNRSYESIVGRIMPGRSFSIGLNYKIQ